MVVAACLPRCLLTMELANPVLGLPRLFHWKHAGHIEEGMSQVSTMHRLDADRAWTEVMWRGLHALLRLLGLWYRKLKAHTSHILTRMKQEALEAYFCGRIPAVDENCLADQSTQEQLAAQALRYSW